MRARLVLAMLASVGTLLLMAPASALADLWVSSSGTDTGFCSQGNPCATLSRALSFAISNSTIYIGAGTFSDHVTVPAVTGLVLAGSGMHATTVSGGFDGSGPVFTIAAGAGVTIENMSITGGQAPNGGGIETAGNLTLEDDEVAFNEATGSAPGAGGDGGGVDVAGGVLSISDSAIVSNEATGRGGGIYTQGATLDRDLIYANRVVSNEPGDDWGGGIAGNATAVNDSTITGNQVVNTSGQPTGSGGAAFVLGNNRFTSDTIVGNTAATSSAIFGAFDAKGTIIDGSCGYEPDAAGGDLDETGTCLPSELFVHTIVGVDPMLGPLADNGGPTQTMAIPASSPAYDANAACSGTDQRGVALLQRGATACDIGAYQVSAPTTYVGNPPAASVTAYATGASGDVSPVLALRGAATGLNRPTGVVADVNGNVFVANAGSNSITKYAPEVTGNATPLATIAGVQTKLNKPKDVALDANGDVWVTNADSSVTEYAAGAHGNVAPIARIFGSLTSLSKPRGLVFDPSGNLRVTNANGTVTTYAATANGNAAALSRLVNGGANGLSTNLQGLNFDAAGNLVLADGGAGRVDSFAGSASGVARPVSTLTGTPSLRTPTGLDLDTFGNVYVAESAAYSIDQFAPGSSGATPPSAVISGPATGLAGPAFLSELPPPPSPACTPRPAGDGHERPCCVTTSS